MHGCRENFGFIPVGDALLLCSIYLGITILLMGIGWLLFRNWKKAALAAFSVMAFHLFFGAIQDWLKNNFNDGLLSRYSFLLPFFAIVFIVFFVSLWKTRKPLTRLMAYLNILFLVLIAIELGYLVVKSTSKGRKGQLPEEFTKCESCPRPDIYVIIADEYAGDKQLRDIFGFDNSAFYDELKNRGFHILTNSRSNYNFTPYSIASALDMNYLGNEKEDKGRLLKRTYSRTVNNSLLRFLNAHGYEFLNYSLLDYEGQPARVDETFLPARTRLITSQTFLSRINKDLRFHLVEKFDSKKELERLTYRTQKNNEAILKLTKEAAAEEYESPRFILTHLMMPHYPYYFDKSGRPLPFDQVKEGNQHDRKNYVEYLQYSNGVFLDLLDKILSNSKSKPIIIFMSDHGFRHFKEVADPSYYFSNHVSIYLPDKEYSAFGDSLTNVNLFRTLLNERFNQKLNYLPDTTYIMENP